MVTLKSFCWDLKVKLDCILANCKYFKCTQYYIVCNCINKKESISVAVADPGFPQGGGTNSKDECEKLLFAYFSQKLHEIERIWTLRGHVSLVPLLDPPMSSMPSIHLSTIYLWTSLNMSSNYITKQESLLVGCQPHICQQYAFEQVSVKFKYAY